MLPGKHWQSSVPAMQLPPVLLDDVLATLLVLSADEDELLELLELVLTGVGVYALRRDGISVRNWPSLGCAMSSGLPVYGIAVKKSTFGRKLSGSMAPGLGTPPTQVMKSRPEVSGFWPKMRWK